jgi:hypothetical protein
MKLTEHEKERKDYIKKYTTMGLKVNESRLFELKDVLIPVDSEKIKTKKGTLINSKKRVFYIFEDTKADGLIDVIRLE